MKKNHRKNGPATFVLVHGAWAWKRIIERLSAKGHQVYAPTLSGLGERSHLANGNINLTTHVYDVINEILWKDLDKVILVGSSYGGLVITGVAEKIMSRIASIVYVDAFIPADGQSFADITGWHPPGDLVDPPPVPKGTYVDEVVREWVRRKVTPQPTATLTQRLRVKGAYQRVRRKTYIRATGWHGPFDSLARSLSSDPSWTVHELSCGHDVANHQPDKLTRLLEANA